MTTASTETAVGAQWFYALPLPPGSQSAHQKVPISLSDLRQRTIHWSVDELKQVLVIRAGKMDKWRPPHDAEVLELQLDEALEDASTKTSRLLDLEQQCIRTAERLERSASIITAASTTEAQAEEAAAGRERLLEEKMAGLRVTVARQTEEIAERLSSTAELQQEMLVLRAANATADSNLAASTARLNQLRRDHDEALAALRLRTANEMQEKERMLEEKMAGLRVTVARQTEEIAERLSSTAELQQEMLVLRAANATADSNLAASTARLNQLRRDHDEALAALRLRTANEMQEKSKALQAAIAKVEGLKVSTQAAQSREHLQRCNELEEQLTKYKQQVKRLEKHVQMLELQRASETPGPADDNVSSSHTRPEHKRDAGGPSSLDSNGDKASFLFSLSFPGKRVFEVLSEGGVEHEILLWLSKGDDGRFCLQWKAASSSSPQRQQSLVIDNKASVARGLQLHGSGYRGHNAAFTVSSASDKKVLYILCKTELDATTWRMAISKVISQAGGYS